MTQAAKALCKWTPFLKKLGNAEPWGIKIQKKHRFSYTGKSIFVTVTEATRTPDFNGNGCFSAVSEATQAPWPLFCARIGVPIGLFCTFFFAKAPGGYANSGAKKGDPPKIFHERIHRFPRQQLSATLARFSDVNASPRSLGNTRLSQDDVSSTRQTRSKY